MRRISLVILFFIASLNVSFAHEAWILTHEEVVNLSKIENPDMFTSKYILFFVFLFSYLLVLFLLTIENKVLFYERKIFKNVRESFKIIGPTVLRWGIALNIGLGALGALPRHGVEVFSSPTLFVPDMQLSLISGNTQWLTILCIIISISLILGFLSRVVAFSVIILSLYTSYLFGERFILYYYFHFIAPALFILNYGGGKFSLDNLLKVQAKNIVSISDESFWKIIQFMTGMTFVALAVGVKLLQPTLIIAILDHAKLSFFGIPTPIAALIMMLVELIAGLLLALGYWVRPIAVFLIGAFTFFAVVLGETPLFHANLYALMFVFLLRGGSRVSIFDVFKKIHLPKWKYKNA